MAKIGQIVQFKTEDGEAVPAIITKVIGDAVNIRIFTNDPSKPAPLIEKVRQGKKKGQWDLLAGD